MARSHPITERANELSDQLKRFRRHIHQHPELSFQEHDTSSFVEDKLREIGGMEVETGIAGTGVVATLSNGEGPTIAVRADMDALPIEEQGSHDYRSQNDGVMHACGHDAHTAILLGVAQLLGESFNQNECKGTVKLLFQPAEEAPDDNGHTGSSYVVQEGVLDEADAAFALHMCPWREVGEAQVNDGDSMANIDMFKGTIRGSGGHGAYPQQCQDPIWMLGPAMQALYGIISRKLSPLESGVLTIGQVHGGTSTNVIPSEVEVEGTLRSYNPEVREFLVDEVEKAFSIVESLGGEADVEITHGEPALKNNPQVNTWLKQTMEELYPSFQVYEGPFGLGGEDFSIVTKEMPGVMFFLGCKSSDDQQRDLHTPEFDIDEACLPYGAAILAETALRYLSGRYKLEDQNQEVTTSDA
ncbi:M20 metallopeptidase family protein [Halobacillus naozhouensis]|uniref:M20 metallopeptidase family protein n=1 Tax=Halobacillus naozhouensis TaxID=554880 RepID=UPI003640A7FC